MTTWPAASGSRRCASSSAPSRWRSPSAPTPTASRPGAPGSAWASVPRVTPL